MGWQQDLIDVYDSRYKTVPDMLPIYHAVNNCEVEVTIDKQGNFVSARRLDKKEQPTIMPTTKKSAIRTSGAEAMPLCEKLDYLCKDFESALDANKDPDSTKYDLYISGLNNWADSEFSCASVVSILQYVLKNSILDDLLSVGVLQKNDSGVFTDLSRSYVRFRVLGVDVPETWMDTDLYDLFIAYNRSVSDEYDICYITGKTVPTKEKHDRYIRSNGDGTKLISSNDTSGYTFRGLFNDYSEAMSIGYDESDKLHRALQWLIRQQSFHIGKDGRYFIFFSKSGSADVDAVQNSATIYDDEDFGTLPEKTTKKSLCEKFKKSVFGGKEYDYDESAIMMCIDAPTTGRLSIIEYDRLSVSSFIDNVSNWHGSVCYSAYDADGNMYFKSPSVYDIIRVAFGDFDNSTKKIAVHGDTRKPLHTLLRCIVNNQNLPRDIINYVVAKASKPQKYDTPTFNYVLKIAVSVIRKYILDMNGGNFGMVYDKNLNDRNYLFGCLLAVFDTAEYSTFTKSERASRQTSAKKLWSMYQKKPYETCMRIRDMISPYLAKSKYSWFYENMIADIMSKFTPESFGNNDPLSPMYILGYYQMKQDMFTKEEVKSETNTKEENNYADEQN